MVKSESLFNLVVARVIAFLHSNNRFLLLKLPTGSGKTTNALNTVNDYADRCWIYLSPFHKNIEENLEMTPHRHKPFKYIHMKSRAKSCIVPQWRELAQKYINIRPLCENRCQLKEAGCPYYEAKRELFNNPQNWAGVHSHITDFLGNFLYSLDPEENLNYRHYDVMIIDENPINVLFINEKGNANDLAHLRNVLKNLNLESPEVEKCNKLLEFLILGYLADKEIDYDELYKIFSKIDFRVLYEEYQVAIIEKIIGNQMEIKDIPREYLIWFDRIQKNTSRRKIENMIVKHERSGYTRKCYYFMCFEETVLHNIPFKIIGLDGTANVDIWASIIDKTPSVFHIPYDYSNMYQLNSGEYPLSSWVTPNIHKIRETGKRLCEIIDTIAKRKKFKVLVCTTKSLKGHIRKQCKARNLIFGYYYYLRSRNDFYQTADTVILACQPNIPEFQLGCFSNLSNWDTDTWRQVFTDEEMVQAVGRIRFDISMVKENKRIREKREIYVFPCKGGLLNPFVDWSKMMSYNEMLDFAADGLLPETRMKMDTEFMWYNIIPYEDGITQTQIRNEYRDMRKVTNNNARIIFREMKKRYLGDITIGKGKKIYKGLANTA